MPAPAAATLNMLLSAVIVLPAHRKSDHRLRRAISKEKHKIYLSFNRWRDCILHSFGYDPLKCPNCGKIMLFMELYFNHKPVPLHELYERVMRKHPCRSPS